MMIHALITRFSYRFQPEADTRQLLSPDRLTARLAIFKKYCYPSIIKQTQPNFYWLLIVDPLLPAKFRTALEEICQANEQRTNYSQRGPRQIILWTWDWSKHSLGKADWVIQCLQSVGVPISLEEDTNYLITSRLDDDDAFQRTLVARIQQQYQLWQGDNRSYLLPSIRYLTFSKGYQLDTVTGHLRPKTLPWIAIGLTVMVKLSAYPITVYCGNHTRIQYFLRQTDKMPSYLKRLFEQNNHLPITPDQTDRQQRVINDGPRAWLRTIHQHHLTSGLGHRGSGSVRQHIKDKLTVDQQELLVNQFGLVMNLKTKKSSSTQPIGRRLIRASKTGRQRIHNY